MVLGNFVADMTEFANEGASVTCERSPQVRRKSPISEICPKNMNSEKSLLREIHFAISAIASAIFLQFSFVTVTA